MLATTLKPLVVMVTAILLCFKQGVYAGWPRSMDKKDKRDLDKIVYGAAVQVPQNLTLFVRYLNRNGKGIARSNAKNRNFIKIFRKLNVAVLVPANKTAIKALLNNDDIEYVEPVQKLRAFQSSHNSQVWQGIRKRSRHLEQSIQDGVKLTQAPELWDVPPVSNITVCLLDSGYGLGHPDLPGLQDGVTGMSTEASDWTIDEFGHGTHCAGVLTGVLGGRRGLNLHIAKILDEKGEGDEAQALKALQSCIDAGAKVVSMSLGGPKFSETAKAAFMQAYDEGVLVVAAAGNNGDDSLSYPASYPYAMSVAAVDSYSMMVADFSQYNDQVEMAGPGVDILSTVTTNGGSEFGYDSWSGTSMATPHVAGVAALVWSFFPDCTNNQIRNVLARTAIDGGKPGCDNEMGYGVIQAKAAYDILNSMGCIAGDPSPLPLSMGAVGGCEQDPVYTHPPTTAPTEFFCDEKVFTLELKTDEWGGETSWEIADFKNEVIASGSEYRSSQIHVENLCLPQGIYTFTIYDSEGDGICCAWGRGEYTVFFDGDKVANGSSFGEKESTNFGSKEKIFDIKKVGTPTAVPKPRPGHTTAPTSSPTSLSVVTDTPLPTTVATIAPSPMHTSVGTSLHPTAPKISLPPSVQLDTQNPSSLQATLSPVSFPGGAVCKDNDSWIYSTTGGKEKRCKYLASKPDIRCSYIGSDGFGEKTTGWVSCPVSCNSCLGSEVQPLASPSPSTTQQPVTSMPTGPPTHTPTVTITAVPSLSPTIMKTSSPTAVPTSHPSSRPTSAPTSEPTMNPTELPSSSLSAQPTLLDTSPSVLSPPRKTCKDDNSWIFNTPGGNEKKCKYLALKPDIRCSYIGSDRFGGKTTGWVSCPIACNSCPGSEVQRASSPSPSVTPSTVTSMPRGLPTHTPTFTITTAPSLSPTIMKASSPTAVPTSQPSSRPTSAPTSEPMMQITELPSSPPSAQPTLLGTSPMALAPTKTDCKDDNSWIHTTKSNQTKKCKFLAKHPSSRCSLVGKNGLGVESTGFVSCRESCGSCSNLNDKHSVSVTTSPSPTVGSTPSPTLLMSKPAMELGNHSACQDDPSWTYKIAGKIMNCESISVLPVLLCESKGKNEFGNTTSGFESCPLSCGRCSSDTEPEDSDCSDDGRWAVTTNKGTKLNCLWAGKDRNRRCKKEGRNASGKKTTGYAACRKSCQQCGRKRSRSDSGSRLWSSD